MKTQTTIKPTFDEEYKLWEKGFEVIGVDEVGRGAFAGPVVAAAVVFDKSFGQGVSLTGVTRSILAQVNDSKLLLPKKREELSRFIFKHCKWCAISQIGVSIINKRRIGLATNLAIKKSICRIQEKNDSGKFFVLVDGFHIRYVRGIGLRHQKAIIKGDRKSISIAAASIVAKVYRDNLMTKLQEQYPQFSFAIHKGYGTKKHQEEIKQFGFSRIHRTSFNLSRFL